MTAWFLRYLALSKWEWRLLWFWVRDHACLVTTALLCSCISLKHKPPCIFSAQRLFRDFKSKQGLPCSLNPLQKFASMESSFEHNDFGKRNLLIVYEGMASATDRIKTPLPAWDRALDFQDDNLMTTLSMIGWNVSDLALRICSGKPKYLELIFTLFQPQRRTEMSPCLVWHVSTEKLLVSPCLSSVQSNHDWFEECGISAVKYSQKLHQIQESHQQTKGE